MYKRQLLGGDVGELRGKLTNQITRIYDVEESMSKKIAEEDKSVLSVKEAMSTFTSFLGYVLVIIFFLEQFRNRQRRLKIWLFCKKVLLYVLIYSAHVFLTVSYTHLDVYKRQHVYGLRTK